MSRSLLAGADLALQAGHVSQVVFLEFDFLSGVSRACSREHDVAWNGFTWVGAGRVGSIEPITEGGELEARGLAMSLSALPAGLLSIALTPSEYKGRNVKLWFGQFEEERYLSLPGTSGNHASTPDSAALSIVDLDVDCDLAMNDWTPTAQQTFAAQTDGATNGWALTMDTGGAPFVEWFSTGPTYNLEVATAVTGAADGARKKVKATLKVNNGAGAYEVKFWTRNNAAEAWVQLGSTKVGLAITNILASAADLTIGRLFSATPRPLAGKVYLGQVKSGIDGPAVAKFDASLMNPRQTSAQMPTGEVWTINQSGSPDAQIIRDPRGVVADPIGPFIFKLDQLTYQLGQMASLRLTGESRLVDWNRPRVRRYNNADHQALHPGDRFFEHTEKQIEAVYRW